MILTAESRNLVRPPRRPDIKDKAPNLISEESFFCFSLRCHLLSLLASHFLSTLTSSLVFVCLLRTFYSNFTFGSSHNIQKVQAVIRMFLKGPAED